MLARLRDLFPRKAAADAGAESPPFALAALLVEAALVDGHFDADEERSVTASLEQTFGLDRQAASRLVSAARERVEGSAEIYGFSRTLRQQLDYEARVRVIELLWHVAYADRRLHDYEANLVRRLAGLLGVDDRDSGTARKRALAAHARDAAAKE